MIEMVYHLQLNAALGPHELRFLGSGMLDIPMGLDSWFGAGFWCWHVGVGLFECVTRRLCVADGSLIQEEIEEEIKRRAALGGGCNDRCGALELKDLRKSFGKTEIIRGANLAVRPASAWRSSAPTAPARARLFNLISGRLAPSSGDVLLNGKRI